MAVSEHHDLPVVTNFKEFFCTTVHKSNSWFDVRDFLSLKSEVQLEAALGTGVEFSEINFEFTGC